jgi:hypothetical protein
VDEGVAALVCKLLGLALALRSRLMGEVRKALAHEASRAVGRASTLLSRLMGEVCEGCSVGSSSALCCVCACMCC